MIEESFCGVWEKGTVFFYSSFEFIERRDNSKGYCSVSVSVVLFVLQWKMQLLSFFYLLTYLTFFPTRKMLTVFWLRCMASRGQQCARGLCVGGILQANLCKQQVILGLQARMLCVLCLGDMQLLGAKLPCRLSKYFLPP